MVLFLLCHGEYFGSAYGQSLTRISGGLCFHRARSLRCMFLESHWGSLPCRQPTFKRRQQERWTQECPLQAAVRSSHLVMLSVPIGLCRCGGGVGRMDRHIHDPRSTWRRLCQWYDCHWILAGHYCRTSCVRVRDTSRWREDGYRSESSTSQ